MHACAALLEEAFSLLNREEKALDEEDLDALEELSQQRVTILNRAWQEREGFDEEELRARLLQMDEAQKRLYEKVDALHAVYREQQRSGRKQAKYFNGDRHLHAQMQKSFYCDKVS